MIDPLVAFLQGLPRTTYGWSACTIVTLNPLQVLLPTGATVPALAIPGLPYSSGVAAVAMVSQGQVAIAFPVGAVTQPPASTPIPNPAPDPTPTPPTPADPIAQFTNTVSDLTVISDATASSAVAGATITSWAWTYGDGASGNGQTVSHVYAQAGTYTQTVTVTDSNGHTGYQSQNVTPTTPPPTVPVQPTGGDTVRYQDLAGSTLDKKLDQAPNGKKVSLPAGAVTFSNFAADDNYGATTDGAGLVGAGRDATTIQIAANTSTKSGKVPSSSGTTNPLYLLKFTRDGVTLDGFTLLGTSQGHLYNGLRIDRSTRPSVSNLRVKHVPGNSDINPGETFYVNFYRCSGIRIHDVDIDGDAVGASGIGTNTCNGGITANDVTTHDLKYCKGWALWEQSGGGTWNRFQSLNNAFGFGFERCDGTYILNDPKFRGSTRADIHLANDGGQWGRAHIVINDPDLAAGQRVKVLLSKTELGNPNKQTRDDVRLYVKGKDRTADLVQFVTSA